MDDNSWKTIGYKTNEHKVWDAIIEEFISIRVVIVNDIEFLRPRSVKRRSEKVITENCNSRTDERYFIMLKQIC